MRAERWDAGRSGAVPPPRSGSGAARSRPSARDRQYDDRQYDDRAYDDRRYDDRAYDDRRYDDRTRAERPAPRQPSSRQPGQRPPQRRPVDDRTGRPVAPGRGPEAAAARTSGSRSAAPASGPRLRGAYAVLGVFLLTLAAAALDSATGIGLGTITTVVLGLSTLVATWLVRRSDLLTLVVAPPLVFVAVALVNTVLAPSATLSLPTVATLLVRGFPAMALGVGAALLVSLFRLATRR
jgi:hypothetical protein